MGEVYKAHDGRRDRTVAIRVLTADRATPESVQRLEQEARAASALNHLNILTIARSVPLRSRGCGPMNTIAIRRTCSAFRAAAIVTVLIVQPVWGQTQTPMRPTAPGTAGDPAWQGTVRMSDGRTFITDGGLAVDAAIAKPAALPARELAGKVLETYMKTPHTSEYGFADLTRAANGKTYTSPNGIALNATYISYLRRIAPRTARFRMAGASQPIVLVADGSPIAVLMPVKQ
jgi:hypothetical protein